ncbi:apoptosis-inducing factor 3 isoform X1 [Octopus sinensis]|uniref:Apoptosis-inducing factor 3 isoform X1 n=1 Tax=Octopus sinensis TaxID=2607531 RepID=A0A7E6EUU3_9MOLL|nr:apoptosis-inducing factor 3 isoform X1 [Octopus sinensis]XP_036359124.1 apoptosis-inducing factor 3 isoform X1 [Octopus sinensis]
MLNLLSKDLLLQRSSLLYSSIRTIVQKSVYSRGKKNLFSFGLETTSGCLAQSSGQASISVNKYSTDKDAVTGLSYKPTEAVSEEPSLNPSPSELSEMEVVVGPVEDLQLGLVKEVAVGDQKVLVVKEKNGVFAFGSKCSHYGLPLANGAYCNGRIRCPFHGACFDVKTGDIEDFPGLDSLHTFKVTVENDIVKLTVPQDKLKEFRRVKPMVKYSSATNKVNLLVGGGPASLICAETLRQEGFTGKIILASKEECIPYDRPKLSKTMSASADSLALRSKDFLKEHDIEFLGEKQLVNIDSEKKKAIFKDGTEISYTNLLLATGGIPRSLEIPGNDLQNVCFLRTPSEANYIATESKGKNAVIIGSSFIGMEVAAAILEKAKSVTVISNANLPFKTVLGSHLAEKILQLHIDKGVKFQFNTSPTELKGNNGKLTSVVLANGEELPADVCVVGIGVTPATAYLEGSPLQKNSYGFVCVNEYMQTNVEGIYAAGDITEFPLFLRSNEGSNVQHWQMAHAQGKNAALNMLGKNTKIRSVPCFWTMMFGKSIRYAGYGKDYNDIVVHGDDEKIACFYTKGEEILAVASLNHDPIVAKVAEIMAEGKMLTKNEVVNKSNKWLFN